MDATQYVYVAEIFPNHLRPQGVALGLTVFYLASEVTLVGAPVALDRIGWKFYLVLIIPSACYLVNLYLKKSGHCLVIPTLLLSQRDSGWRKGRIIRLSWRNRNLLLLRRNKYDYEWNDMFTGYELLACI